MRIAAYRAADADAPHPWIARLYETKVTPKGPKFEWQVILFSGHSEGSVRAQAQQWWENELAKAEAKHAPRKPKTAPEPVPADDEIGDVL